MNFTKTQSVAYLGRRLYNVIPRNIRGITYIKLFSDKVGQFIKGNRDYMHGLRNHTRVI